MPPPRSSGRSTGRTTGPAAACSVGQSLAADDGLTRLLARVRESQARLEAVADAIPAPLRSHLRSGPLDDDGWTILAANAAVAAKLRHLLPLLGQALLEKGWEATAIQVRIQR